MEDGVPREALADLVGEMLDPLGVGHPDTEDRVDVGRHRLA